MATGHTNIYHDSIHCRTSTAEENKFDLIMLLGTVPVAVKERKLVIVLKNQKLRRAVILDFMNYSYYLMAISPSIMRYLQSKMCMTLTLTYGNGPR